MRPWMFLLASLLLLPVAGRAQTVINRCVASDGHPVFTDRPCASLGAVPAPADADRAPPPDTRPPAVTCAIDADTLQQAVVEAFAAHDANRLAGLMLWGGAGERAAVQDIGQLGRLMDEPLLGIEPGPTDGGTPSALVVSTVAGTTDFPIVRQAGCLWLRSP